MGPEIRPATVADIRDFYGRTLPQTVKAYVVVLDGKPIGVGGLAYQGKHQVIFSDILPELKAFPLTICRAGKKIMGMAKGSVGALADPNEPTAHRFLSYLGFTHVTSIEAGEVYQWHQSQ